MKQWKNIFLTLQRLLFYTIILFLPTQLGKHFWPSFSYVSGIRIDYLSPTVYLTDILIVSLFVLLCIRSVVNKISKFSIFNLPSIIYFLIYKLLNEKIIEKWKMKNRQLFTVIMVFVLLFGVMQSRNPEVGLYGLVKMLEFLFFGWVTFILLSNKKIFSIATILLAFGVIGESFLAIAQSLQQGSINGFFYFLGERTFTAQTPGIANASLNGELVLRPYGTFPHPNVLAGYLVIVMTIVIYHLPFTIYHFKKYIFIFSLIIGSIALFITLSRVAILLWMLVLIVCFFKFLEKRNHKSSIINRQSFIGLLVAFVFIGSVFFSPLYYRFSQISITDESLVLRKELIIASLSMIKQHFLLGVGSYNFLPSLPYYFQKNHTSSFYTSFQPVHNIYLLIFSETGIVGFSFFLWFIYKTLQKVKNQKLKIKNTTQNEKSSIHYPLFAILILGLFDHYFLTLQQGQLLLALVFGYCWAKSVNK